MRGLQRNASKVNIVSSCRYFVLLSRAGGISRRQQDLAMSIQNAPTTGDVTPVERRIVGSECGMLQTVPAEMSSWYTLFPYSSPRWDHSRSNRPADTSRSMTARIKPLRFAGGFPAANKRPFCFRSVANSATSERICSSGTSKSFTRLATMSSVDLRSLINAQIFAPTGLRLKQMPC